MRETLHKLIISVLLIATGATSASGATAPGLSIIPPETTRLDLPAPDIAATITEMEPIALTRGKFKPAVKLNIYDLPYSRTLSIPDWNRLWVNTAVLVGGGATAMIVLECLPEESTAWNKSENAKTPLFKRYIRHIKEGPVWDGDKFIFNFILHPYGGAAYYMSARSCGFNCWGSFLYSFCISTFFWEYGFEAFNEIPSVQDLVITPVVGSLMGEGFYIAKRHIVNNGYRLFGSPVLGYIAAFFCDPVNEVVGYFKGSQKSAARHARQRMGEGLSGGTWITPGPGGMQYGLTLTYNF